MNNKETFNYTYSAKEQEEIKAIREKYIIKEHTTDKMAQLRYLDAKTTRKATVMSLVFGVVGTLILGIGMSLIMTGIGKIIGLVGVNAVIIGSVVGVLGLILIGLAYPLYGSIAKREREKIAPEIIKLTNELMK